MPNIFDSVKINRVKSSTFDLSHDVKLSFDMGKLVPVLVMETLPGDKFNISNETLIRFQPMVAPVMHRMDVFVHYFFVPNRILWPNWENFITQTKVGTPIPAVPAAPTLQITEAVWDASDGLLDYMGIPRPATGTNAFINPMALAAYQKIWLDYYIDKNLQNQEFIPLVDGSNDSNDPFYFAHMNERAWEKDYFTSALPFAQKGDAVAIPSTIELGNWTGTGPTPPLPHFESVAGTQPGGYFQAQPTGGPGIDTTGASGTFLAYDPEGTLVNTGTIEELRQANALQKFLEKLARGGSRYVEYTKSIFNVRSSDQRMQRAEYITGTKSPVVISEVLNTTGTEDAPQGQMAGHGISVGNGSNGYYSCEEHGYIIGIMSVLPKTAYMQGIPKHFLKNDAFDYATPDFANLGEQPILNQEIYAYQGATIDNDVFGYTPRYAEYKFELNRVAGDFRTTLDFWHLARKFATPPALNADFVVMQSTAADRIFAVTDPTEQKLLAQVFNKVRAVRPLPKFGTPTF